MTGSYVDLKFKGVQSLREKFIIKKKKDFSWKEMEQETKWSINDIPQDKIVSKYLTRTQEETFTDFVLSDYFLNLRCL